MSAVEERICDRKLLKLVRGMLRAGVMEHGSVHHRVTGTPQGGVISPLLANVYLHRLDRRWQTRAADGFGEGVDFLGVHHRTVRGNTRHSRHLVFLARWPSRKAMQHARDRIGAVTARSRLEVPLEAIVRGIMRGWVGYFRYGNSARALVQIRSHAINRLALFVANVTSSTATTAGRWSSTCHRITWD